MAEASESREDLLRGEYLGQTARINWHELQTFYAAGSVVKVGGELDLVEVAVQLGLDNSAQFEQWIEAGDIAPITDEQALAWYDANTELWSVVASPWVLVQHRVS
jgi:hypothetical protein